MFYSWFIYLLLLLNCLMSDGLSTHFGCQATGCLKNYIYLVVHECSLCSVCLQFLLTSLSVFGNHSSCLFACISFCCIFIYCCCCCCCCSCCYCCCCCFYCCCCCGCRCCRRLRRIYIWYVWDLLDCYSSSIHKLIALRQLRIFYVSCVCMRVWVCVCVCVCIGIALVAFLCRFKLVASTWNWLDNYWLKKLDHDT